MTEKQHLPVINSGSREAIQGVLLVLGKWRQAFNDEKRKLIIAGALNDCVWNRSLSIKGYLITNTRLYLVINCDNDELNGKLLHFYQAVKREIMHDELNGANSDDNRPEHSLFTRFDLTDDNRIRLLSGKKVHLKFDDPRFDRFKQETKKSRYCSVIDYSGALGPVCIAYNKMG